jgi:prepilin-type N-terminal cleavage/methylation domain-containing protein
LDKKGGDMNKIKNTQRGFTIVELLIVIVVIGILAAITLVAYNGIQDRARSAKIQADLGQIEKAIIIARMNTNQALHEITGSTWSAEGCEGANNGTDLTNTSITTVATCWAAWDNFRDTVSTASGVNIRNIVDPWERPYYIDENEGENGGSCTEDWLGRYLEPHQQWNEVDVRDIPNSLPSCL